MCSKLAKRVVSPGYIEMTPFKRCEYGNLKEDSSPHLWVKTYQASTEWIFHLLQSLRCVSFAIMSEICVNFRSTAFCRWLCLIVLHYGCETESEFTSILLRVHNEREKRVSNMPILCVECVRRVTHLECQLFDNHFQIDYSILSKYSFQAHDSPQTFNAW